MMTLRQHYDEKLEEIRSDILRMAGIAGEMVRLAVDAVINGDLDQAQQVMRMDDEVDDLEKDTIHRAVSVVATEAPVAGDLRFLVATLGVIGEIEKVADDAVKLSRRAKKLTGHFPPELKLALNEMGEQARTSFAGSIRLFTAYDPALASKIVAADEDIDTRYVEARNRAFELIQRNPAETSHLVRTIEAFHALEHVADHAVEIACRLRLHYEARACA